MINKWRKAHCFFLYSADNSQYYDWAYFYKYNVLIIRKIILNSLNFQSIIYLNNLKVKRLVFLILLYSLIY